MQASIRSGVRVLHCLRYNPWLVLLLLLWASTVHAAPQDIDIACMPAPAPHEFTATVGMPFNAPIGSNAGGNVFWDFVTTPVGCSGSSPSFTCNGVNIALPAGAPGSSVPNTATVTVNGTPSATGGPFTFRLVVTLDDGIGTTTCERNYELDVVNPPAPYDLVFELDRSGSMSGSTNIAPPATDRWGALKNGVNSFLPMIDSTAPPGSRFGLTLFATDVLPTTNPAFTALLPVPSSPPNTLPNAVNTELNQQSPGGATAMGKGLKTAMSKLTDVARPRVVVIFTDGEQNIPPLVNSNGCGFDDGTQVNPTCPATPGTIKIVTVGIGNPSGAYLTTLQNLAHNNRGHMIITANGANFGGDCTGNVSAAFSCAIADTLSVASPQMVTSYSGTLSNTPVTLQAFDVNRKVAKLLVQITFNRQFNSEELAAVLAGLRIAKDGSDITPYFQPVTVGTSSDGLLLKTDFVPPQTSGMPPLAPEGRYTLHMTKPTFIRGNLDYRVVPYADDHRLSIDWQVSPTTLRVNQPLTPAMHLSWLGSPVTNARVEAFIVKPGGDLGDLLAKNPLKVETSQAPDAGSPGHQKYFFLLQNDPKFLAQLRPRQQRLPLIHQGKGNYSAPYNPGNISGVYQILYRARAIDPKFGTIQRLAVQSVYVRFGVIDLKASAIKSTVEGNTITINVRPKRTNGLFIGPAQGGAFTVQSKEIRLRTITDHQDGSYTLVLVGDPKAPVAVELLGEVIYRGPRTVK
jgi:hypothetical protein